MDLRIKYGRKNNSSLSEENDHVLLPGESSVIQAPQKIISRRRRPENQRQARGSLFYFLNFLRFLEFQI